MSELEMYKWFQEHEPEWRWDINPDTKQEDVIIWISIYSIEAFYSFVSPSYFNDGGGINARLVDHHIAIWANEICEHFGIETEQIFPKN